MSLRHHRPAPYAPATIGPVPSLSRIDGHPGRASQGLSVLVRTLRLLARAYRPRGGLPLTLFYRHTLRSLDLLARGPVAAPAIGDRRQIALHRCRLPVRDRFATAVDEGSSVDCYSTFSSSSAIRASLSTSPAKPFSFCSAASSSCRFASSCVTIADRPSASAISIKDS
jgi:hypothetical protein